jgi:hypothetical protein
LLAESLLVRRSKSETGKRSDENRRHERMPEKGKVIAEQRPQDVWQQSHRQGHEHDHPSQPAFSSHLRVEQKAGTPDAQGRRKDDIAVCFRHWVEQHQVSRRKRIEPQRS